MKYETPEVEILDLGSAYTIDTLGEASNEDGTKENNPWPTSNGTNGVLY